MKQFVEITTSSFCTNACSFCPQKLFHIAYKSKSQNPVQLMSMETFQKAVNWAPPKFGIIFSGFSEPFMNPLCTEMILHAHRNKRLVALFTTLIGASMKNIKTILSTLSFGKGKDLLYIHLPSDDKTEHFNINNNYLKILQYILSSVGDNINIHYHGNDVRKEIKRVLKSSRRKADHWELLTRSGVIRLPNKPAPKLLHGSIRCRKARNMHLHTILPDGTVVLCCNDFGMRHVLGNIYMNDYNCIRAGKEMKRVLRGLDDETTDILCRKCYDAINNNIRLAYYKKLFSITKISKYFQTKFAYLDPNIYKQLRSFYRNIQSWLRNSKSIL